MSMIVRLVITSDFEKLCVNRPELNEDLPQIDCMDGIVEAFKNQWGKFRPKRRFGCAKPE